jgi:murein DD-endopeptidase MepM/ murein hydrolase activator NlpD
MEPFLNVVDFLIPDGTPVLAAQEGKIVELVEHNTEWGDGDKYRDTLNFMTLVHQSGELTQYCHLAKGAVSALGLQVGSGVKQGQRIATVGKTGWTDRDHLHFLAFRYDKRNPDNPFGFKSLVPRFR